MKIGFIEVSPDSGSGGSNKVNITADPNTTTSVRGNDFRITNSNLGEEVRISQKAGSVGSLKEGTYRGYVEYLNMGGLADGTITITKRNSKFSVSVSTDLQIDLDGEGDSLLLVQFTILSPTSNENVFAETRNYPEIQNDDGCPFNYKITGNNVEMFIEIQFIGNETIGLAISYAQ